MKVDVMDTHVTTHNGQRLHFDVLLPSEKRHEAEAYARHWLEQKGMDVLKLEQFSCNFCHSQASDANTLGQIQEQGYRILVLQH